MRAALTFGLFFFIQVCTAQFWKSLGGGGEGNTAVSCLYGDSISDGLLAGGSFALILNEDGPLRVMGISKWNGTRWDSLGHALQEDGGGNNVQITYWFLRFQEELFACGGWGFFNDEGVVNRNLAKYNAPDQHWTELACPNPFDSGLLTLVPKRPTDKLYATGYNGSLCDYPEACVFEYVDGTFQPWAPWAQIPYDNGNYVGTVIEYRGYTYMSGDFHDPLSDGFATFMRWNGSAWEDIPGWNSMGIKDIAIHNDTMYVAGAFRVVTGGPGNGIARFDGENWDGLGSGLLDMEAPFSTVVLDMEWLNGELWVCGGFTTAGGVPAECLAKWNGSQWCAVAFDQTTISGGEYSTLRDMAVWRDSLYVCGGFGEINGEPIRHVAQWMGGDAVVACSPPVSVPETPSLPVLRLAPNPSAGLVRLGTIPAGAVGVRVTDALGRTVAQMPLGNGTVNVELLRPGAYMLHALDVRGQVLAAGRFVRE